MLFFVDWTTDPSSVVLYRSKGVPMRNATIVGYFKVRMDAVDVAGYMSEEHSHAANLI